MNKSFRHDIDIHMLTVEWTNIVPSQKNTFLNKIKKIDVDIKKAI